MADPEPEGAKSFGNISDRHWSRARAGMNEEALAYYRERSHAPGVEEGGGPRNFYCMHCDGVIPVDPPLAKCPHCGGEITGVARRYFNWVELDQPARSDFRSLLPHAAGGAFLLLLIAAVVAWILA
jgi:hypothetical protein